MEKKRKMVDLVEAFEKIAARHAVEIQMLPLRGPKGGENAKYIPEWKNLGIGTITKACHQAGIPTHTYWSGYGATPSRAVPAVIADELYAAWEMWMGEVGKKRQAEIREMIRKEMHRKGWCGHKLGRELEQRGVGDVVSTHDYFLGNRDITTRTLAVMLDILGTKITIPV